MTWILIVPVCLFVWWLFGLLNVAGVQMWGTPAVDFHPGVRGSTLVMCFGLGPILTLGVVTFFMVRKPIQLGTRWGRYLGRKINPDNY
jgi:hypothetical protein